VCTVVAAGSLMCCMLAVAFLLWRVFVMCVWAWPVMDRISGTFLLEDMTRGTWIALEGA